MESVGTCIPSPYDSGHSAGIPGKILLGIGGHSALRVVKAGLLVKEARSNLNVSSFESLQGRKITLFPRTDAAEETYLSFLELADQVKRCYKDIDISVSRFLEDNANDDQKRREIDLLQYLLE